MTGLGFAVVSQILGWYCPLTYLEIWLREHQRGANPYSGSFIAHYAEELVYLRVSPELIFILTIALTGATVWLYVKSFRKTRHFAHNRQ